MPPTKRLFLPLVFWLDIIANLDKRIEIMCSASGYGVVTIDIKLREGKIYEVGIEEKTRLREIVPKAGDLGYTPASGSSKDS